jgi:hypothetical protein
MAKVSGGENVLAKAEYVAYTSGWPMIFERKAILETAEVSMNPCKEHLRLCFIASIGVALVISLVGCSTRTTPPGATTIGTSAPGMNITYLGWKEGLRVLFVDDVKGSHSSQGSGSTDNAMYTASGSAGAVDAGGYRWQIETRDGKSATCQINGKEYDLSKGTLFVIQATGEQVEVHQLQRDLSNIPLNAEGCREAVREDAEIRKVLGTDPGDAALREARKQADAILTDLLAGKLDNDPALSPVARKLKGYDVYSIESQKIDSDRAAHFGGMLSRSAGRARFEMVLVKQQSGNWAVATFSGPNLE